MGVFIRRTRKGIYPNWIGFWQDDGKRHETTLCRWEGKPPEKGEREGDAAFERSRERAVQMFKAIRAKGKSREEEGALARKILVARYGGRVERVRLSELYERWEAHPHRAGEERRKRVRAVVNRFVEWMGEHYAHVTEAGALQGEHFKGFLDEVERRGIAAERKKRGGRERGREDGVSARTWNDVVFTLRSVLEKAGGGDSEGFREYLSKVPYKDEETVHKRPFTGRELEGIFRAAGEVDEGLRPVIVAAACTALRRGDVAQLKWRGIDMEGGFITVKTTKTGETVEIPIFPPLMAVLREAEGRRRKGEKYVWPEVAEDYRQDRNRLDRRLKRVLLAAGFVRPKAGKEEEAEGTSTVAAKGEGKRRNRGSLCGWHSFRTTFCSLALANGVPMELLTRITGHRSVEVVERYYNRAKREQSRRAFGEAMPRAIAGAAAGAGEVLEMVGFSPARAEAARRLAECGEDVFAKVARILKG